MTMKPTPPVKHCMYCGTELLDDGWREAANPAVFHFSSICVERVYAALCGKRTEVAQLEARLAQVNKESASDKALINRITEICPDCPAEDGCERCDGAGVIPFDAVAEGALEHTCIERDAALEQVDLLRGAIEWYADRENYSTTSAAPYNDGLDHGRVARQALALARLLDSGVPLDHCEMCGARREAWQRADDIHCPRRPSPKNPCYGTLVTEARAADEAGEGAG